MTRPPTDGLAESPAPMPVPSVVGVDRVRRIHRVNTCGGSRPSVILVSAAAQPLSSAIFRSMRVHVVA